MTQISTSRRVVALTFDAGAGNEGVASIVATLRREGVPASFFVTGAWASQNPALVRALAAVGPVGNHTYDHPHLPTLTDAQIRAQLDRTREIVLDAAGAETRPRFRFPFGDYSTHTLGVVNDAGYLAVGWTVDSLGWQGTSGGMTAAKVTGRVLAALTPGEIVLMHVGAHPTDHSTLDADALPQVIAALRAAGYTFVTLDALAG